MHTTRLNMVELVDGLLLNGFCHDSGEPLEQLFEHKIGRMPAERIKFLILTKENSEKDHKVSK